MKTSTLTLVASGKIERGERKGSITLLASTMTEARTRLLEMQPRAINIRGEMGVGDPGRPWPFSFEFDLAPEPRMAPLRLVALLTPAPLSAARARRVAQEKAHYYDGERLLECYIPALNLTAVGRGIAGVATAAVAAVEQASRTILWRTMDQAEAPPIAHSQHVGERVTTVAGREVVIELLYSPRPVAEVADAQ